MYVPEYAKITHGVGKLTPEVMARLGAATEITLSQQSAEDARAENTERGYKWMRIVGHSDIQSFSGKEAKWVYTVKPTLFSIGNATTFSAPTATTVVDGSDAVTVRAMNFAEWGTDANVITPGIQWSNVPSGFELLPIANNTVVLCVPTRLIVGVVTAPSEIVTLWGFSMANAFDGECV